MKPGVPLSLMFAMMLNCAIFTAGAQPLVDIGLYGSGTDTLVVKLIPRGFFNGIVSNVVFTLRWESTCGAALGDVIQSGAAAIYIPMTKSGAPKISGDYTYQVFGGTGMQPLSSLGTSWANGNPVTLLKLPVAGGRGVFEIDNDSWIAAVDNNAHYFVSLNGQQKTGAIFQGKYAFAKTSALTICEGDSVMLGGAYRTISGSYYDTLQSSDGCDSIVLTILSVHPSPTISRSVSICQGQDFYAGGAWQTTPGVYYDYFSSGTACDSIVITHLTVSPGYSTTRSISICQGQSFYAGGALRNSSGVYYDRFTAKNGCDSVLITHLTVNPAYSSTRLVKICQGESFFAGGAFRTAAGTYFDHYTSRTGCDSVVITSLVVYPHYIKHIYMSICQGSAIIAGGDYRFESGIYYDTLTTRFGCDSVIVTHLAVAETIHFNRDVTVCTGGGVFAEGMFRTMPGTYYDTLVASFGCDSIVITNLTVTSTLTSSNTAEICSGESYLAGGAWRNSSGIYYDTLISQLGCDSIVTTLLTVQPSLASARFIQICTGENFYAGGAYQSAPGVYSDTFIASSGCDSLITTILSVVPPKIASFHVSICSASGYFAGGAIRTTSGNYYDTLDAVNGCDSVMITHLSVMPVRTSHLSASICSGERYFAAGAFRTTAGDYYDTLQGSNGCDSIIITHISVIPAKTTNISVSICEGDSYLAGGVPRTAAGVYRDTLTTSEGCDSILITHLSVFPVKISVVHATICAGESYFAAGASQTIAGVYRDTLTTSEGCDSIIETRLSVLPAAAEDFFVSICRGERYFAGGAMRTTSGIYTDVLTATNGCDSTVVTHLSVLPKRLSSRYVSMCAGDSFFVAGAYRKFSGIYRDTLIASNGCDSTVVTTLAVQQLIPKVRNAGICLGDSIFTGGSYRTTPGNYYDTLAGIRCDTLLITSLSVFEPVIKVVPATICSNESYFAAGAYRNSAGIYYDTFAAHNGCDSIVITVLHIMPAYFRSYSLSICEGDSVYAGGRYRHFSGVYSDTFITNTGCDSIIVTQLSVFPHRADTAEVTICSNENYFAGGALRNISGIYFDTLDTQHGCDSIITTILNVNSAYSFTRHVFICSSDSFFAGGKFRRMPGLYYDTIPAHNSCDSITITDLKVYPAHLTAMNVHICENDSFFAAGGYQTMPGIYYHTLENRFGCDSTIQTSLIVQPDPAVNWSAVICEGDSFFAGGAWRKEAAAYYDTFTARGGCDSMVITHLFVAVQTVETIAVQLCAGDSIHAGGAFKKLPGVYHDTLVSRYGCDSIIHTAVTVLPLSTDTLHFTICENQGVLVNGTWRSTSGTYYDTLDAVNGCDSVVVVTIEMLPAVHYTLNIFICEGESYFAGGALRTTDGIYRDTFKADNGCDSIVTTRLKILPRKSVFNPITICSGQSYFAAGQQRTRTGVYPDTFATAYGCDSVVLTILNVLPPLTMSVEASICDNEQYFAGGALRNTAGVYRDTLSSALGCDSILTTVLYINPSYSTSRSVILCSGDSIFLQGEFRNVSGVYRDTFHAANGCDSIIVTNLSVVHPSFTARTISLCDGDSVWARGAWQTAAGTYFDTLMNSSGCDSVIMTYLTVNSVTHSSLDVSVCSNEGYVAGGAVRTTSGTYFDTLISHSGCDSIVITRLAVRPAYSQIIDAAICSGETYFAGGSLHSASGIYYDTFTAANGCDSVVITALTVHSSFTFANTVSICEGSGYFAGGAYQTVPGTYYDTLYSSSGCDSIIVTQLNVLHDSRTDLNVTICHGESYYLQGDFQNTTGVYYDTLWTVSGCDSVVTAHLTVLPPLSDTVDVIICSNESYFAQGAYRNTSGIYFDLLQSAQGCDSMVVTMLTVLPAKIQTRHAVICAGEHYFFGDRWYHSTGVYRDTLTAANGCDSIEILNLTVQPFAVREINVVICPEEAYYAGGAYQTSEGTYYDTFAVLSGCDSIIITHLSVSRVSIVTVDAVLCDGGVYYAGGAHQTSAGIYYDTFLNRYGCDSIVITTLNASASTTQTVSAIICEGESYVAGGARQTQPGIYTDTFTAFTGCDSIVITNLSVRPRYYLTKAVAICSSDSVFLNGAFRHEPGIYPDTFTASTGCDSIIATHLVLLPAYTFYEYFTICADDSIFLAGSIRTASGMYADSFTARNGCDSVILSFLTVLPPSTGSVAYSVCEGEGMFIAGAYRTTAGTYYDTLPGFSGCDSITAISLLVHPLPPADAGMDRLLCRGESATLTAYGGVAYSWSTSETTAVITVIPSATASFTVRVTNSFGCHASDTVTVFVNPLPQVSFTGLRNVYCTADEEVVLTGTPAGGTFIGQGVIGNVFNPVNLSPGSYVISYRYTDSLGCSAYSGRAVTVTSLQQASFAGLDSAYCIEAASHPLSGYPSGGVFSGAGISGNKFVPAIAGAGMHPIVYTHISPAGCVSSDTQFVEVYPLPHITFEITDKVFCLTDTPFLLQASPHGGIFSGIGVADSFFHPVLAGAGSAKAITYHYTDANGCSATATQYVDVRNNPEPVLSGLSVSYCISHPGVILNGTPSGGTFSGRGVSDGIFTPRAAGVGAHWIAYTYTDSFNCTGKDDYKVLVYAIPRVTLAGLESVYCANASPVRLMGLPPGGQFSGRGVLADVFDPGAAGAGGPYPICYTYADISGCNASDTLWVTVNPLPRLTFQRNDFTFCREESAIELPIIPHGGTFIGEGISDNMFYPSRAGAGFHQIAYVFTDTAGCSNSISITVAVELCSGMALPASEGWQIYPNPFDDRLLLQLPSLHIAQVHIRLTNMFGQNIFKKSILIPSGTNNVSLQSLQWLPPGVYHLEIITGNTMALHKVVKSK